jgi:hypothetical protein
MSTDSTGDGAPTVDSTPATPPVEGPRRRRVGRLVLGSFLAFVGLALGGGVVAAIYGLENNTDSAGYYVTHVHHYETSSYALSTETFSIGGVSGVLAAGLARVRLTVTSNEASKPIFVGIASTRNVNDYLNQVSHDELRDINLDPFTIDYHRLGAGAPTSPPGEQTFWQAQATGSGTQTVSWPVATGLWSAVVMNADGTGNVSVDAQVAARLSGAWWIVGVLIALSLLFLVGGGALIRSGLHRPVPKTTAEA